MQGRNIGIADAVITRWEYRLRNEYIENEKTPVDTAAIVSAFSQMWLFAVYEVMRIWRDRRYKYDKWHKSGGLNQILENLDTEDEDDLNFTKHVKRRQVERYRDDEDFRNRSEREWELFKPVYRMVELLRVNLAKHLAPGKDTLSPRTPGYGIINMSCGAMDFEVLEKDGSYSFLNRRDVADALRSTFSAVKT
jgi:hypothetical protein